MNRFLNTMLLFILTGYLFTIAACDDDVSDDDVSDDDASDGDADGDSDGDSDTDADTDSDIDTAADSDTDTAADSIFDIYSVERCKEFCEFELECMDMETDETELLWECQELCDVTMPLYKCVFSLVDSVCEQAYMDMYQCVYGITSCAQLDLYFEGVGYSVDDDDATITTDAHICSSEHERYMSQCADTFESTGTADTDALEPCADEIAAFQAFTGTE